VQNPLRQKGICHKISIGLLHYITLFSYLIIATNNQQQWHRERAIKLCRAYSLKDKLPILLEWEEGSLGHNAVARQYRLQPCQLRTWKKNREVVLSATAAIKNVTVKQQYLAKKTTHEGRKPSTEMAELVPLKQVYDDLIERERDQVVTLSLFTHDLRRHNLLLQTLSIRSVRCRVHQNLYKQGVV
jgi:hypothetical protein